MDFKNYDEQKLVKKKSYVKIKIFIIKVFSEYMESILPLSNIELIL